jgi:predicted O-methyltransferase YrrM
MEGDLSRLLSLYRAELDALPAFERLEAAGFGVGYNDVDALMLYMQIRDLKPARYLEVGSGLSTYYCHLAAARNAQEGRPLEITCVEPFPYAALHTIPGIRVIASEVQDVELSLFERLEANDVLFIDSSHILRIDGDVPFLYLEVLPRLKVGTVVHIHDIAFPYNIPFPPEHWVLGQVWPIQWNEAMILQAFLAFNDRFRITMSLPLVQHFDEAFLRSNLPGYRHPTKDRDTFSSIWLRRVT